MGGGGTIRTEVPEGGGGMDFCSITCSPFSWSLEQGDRTPVSSVSSLVLRSSERFNLGSKMPLKLSVTLCTQVHIRICFPGKSP